jgi:hypothetical protein
MGYNMKNKTKHQKFYRCPRTTQERRINGKRSEYGRAKRNQSNLVNAYYDKPTCVQKTWKVKRKHQYRVDGRGKKYQITINPKGLLSDWLLKQWFDEHDIPCRLIPIYKLLRSKPHKQRIKYVERYIEKYITHYDGTVEHYQHPVHGYKYIQPREYVYRHLIGYQLTWWCHKDIDIDNLLRSLSLEV